MPYFKGIRRWRRKIMVAIMTLILSYASLINTNAQQIIPSYEYCHENEDCLLCLTYNFPYLQETLFLANEYDVDPNLVLAIIYNESRFQEDAISYYGNTINYGLMQVNSCTYNFLKDYITLNSEEDLLDPITNINAGIVLLDYHSKFTDDNDYFTLMRYQVGEGNYDRMIDNGIFTYDLTDHVMNLAESIE